MTILLIVCRTLITIYRYPTIIVSFIVIRWIENMQVYIHANSILKRSLVGNALRQTIAKIFSYRLEHFSEVTGLTKHSSESGIAHGPCPLTSTRKKNSHFRSSFKRFDTLLADSLHRNKIRHGERLCVCGIYASEALPSNRTLHVFTWLHYRSWMNSLCSLRRQSNTQIDKLRR